jgi:MFS superfamily sulfate permease-like transporter
VGQIHDSSDDIIVIRLEGTNLYINVDGVFDITREKVEQSLQETIENILHYCGGKLKMAGIVQG